MGRVAEARIHSICAERVVKEIDEGMSTSASTGATLRETETSYTPTECQRIEEKGGKVERFSIVG